MIGHQLLFDRDHLVAVLPAPLPDSNLLPATRPETHEPEIDEQSRQTEDASDAADAGGKYVYCIIRHDRVRGAETPA